MNRLDTIFGAIARDGFTKTTLEEINKYINDIQNGTEDFHRFNLSEHAGLCTAGAPLVGASIIACYATASLEAGSNAEGSEGGPPNRGINTIIYPSTTGGYLLAVPKLFVPLQ